MRWPFRKKQTIPDWHQPAPGRCPSWLRALGAISCGYPCDLQAGHAGMHECTMHDPIYLTTHTTRWTERDSQERNTRNPYFDPRPVPVEQEPDAIT